MEVTRRKPLPREKFSAGQVLSGWGRGFVHPPPPREGRGKESPPPCTDSEHTNLKISKLKSEMCNMCVNIVKITKLANYIQKYNFNLKLLDTEYFIFIFSYFKVKQI
jgi:hypothetical protein